MKDYYEFGTEGDPYISSVDGQPKYSMLDFRPWIKHEVPQTTPLYNEGGTYNLDRLGQLINRFSDGKHPEMVASLQRQLDAETARINTGYQNARNDFAQVGANLPQTYDLAGDYQHAQAMNAVNYDNIRRNQASAPRQAGYYNSTLSQLPEYDTMNRNAMAYQEEQRRIAAERARQEAAERAYLEEQARKNVANKNEIVDDYGFDYGAQGEGQNSLLTVPTKNTTPAEPPEQPRNPIFSGTADASTPTDMSSYDEMVRMAQNAEALNDEQLARVVAFYQNLKGKTPKAAMKLVKAQEELNSRKAGRRMSEIEANAEAYKQKQSQKAAAAERARKSSGGNTPTWGTY